MDGEALAVVWCLQKAQLFLLGCPNLVVVTDHLPLMLLGDWVLYSSANPRLFRLNDKTLQYKFQIKFLAEKRNTAADALSRYLTLKAPHNDDDKGQKEELVSAMIAATVTALRTM